jgi:hypothetical protein
MIIGRNLHPLTEYVNRRVQEGSVKRGTLIFILEIMMPYVEKEASF